MNEIMNNNTVYLTGEIAEIPTYSHQIYGEGFYETKMSVARLSEQVDLIPITISERLISENGISIGDKLSIVGQFRSYNKIIDGRSKLMLTVFVRELIEEDNEFVNQIDLTGYVCKPPIYRTTPFKREIADILVAVNRAYNKSDYIPCIAWGRNARFASNLDIGTKISLSGRIQSREYQKMNSSGEYETKVAYEISISRIGYSDLDNEIN